MAVWSRLLCAARWVAPSVTAACAGAIAIGVVESAGHTPHRMLATTGFVAVVALPVLVVAALATRAIVHAWQPRELLARLVEPDGAAPRLAGWIAATWLAILALAWAMFQGTWLLAKWTAFKPRSASFLFAVLGIAAWLALVALSRPAARLFAHLARRLDAGWRRIARPPLPPTLLRPRIVIGGAALAAVLAGWVIWELAIEKRARGVRLGFLWAVAAGAIAAAAFHARRLRGRAIALATVTVIAAALAVAWHAGASRPAFALAIWADEPIARRGIERVFDVEGIRRALPPATFLLPSTTARRHPDLVLVTFEAMPAARTPLLGGGAPMPALAELGRRGAVFASAFTTTPVAQRAIPSIATGLDPARLRGRFDGRVVRLDPRHALLADHLRGGGYETAAFACCPEYWGASGWDRGIEHLEVLDDGARIAAAARRWIASRRGDRPLFVWLHIPDPASWRGGGTEAERLRRLDVALAAADAALRDVLAAFADRPPEAAPIVIATAIAGQELAGSGDGELSAARLHVPLAIAGPGIEPRRIVETASLAALAPTVLELAGFRPPAWHARSLADLVVGRRTGTERAGIAHAVVIDERRGAGRVRSAIVRGPYKLVDTGHGHELFDLRADAAERVNLFGRRPRLVAELKRLLALRLRAARVPPF